MKLGTDTNTVEIKSLVVNSKEMTLSVFMQIKEENIIDDGLQLKGEPWGLVNIRLFGNKEAEPYILWQKGTELRRCLAEPNWNSFFTSEFEYKTYVQHFSSDHYKNWPEYERREWVEKIITSCNRWNNNPITTNSTDVEVLEYIKTSSANYFAYKEKYDLVVDELLKLEQLFIGLL